MYQVGVSIYVVAAFLYVLIDAKSVPQSRYTPFLAINTLSLTYIQRQSRFASVEFCQTVRTD